MSVNSNHSLALTAEAQKRIGQLETLWGRACIGLALLTAYHQAPAPRSAADIGTMAGVSEDTALRYLRKLANIGRVELSKAGRCTLYACPPHLAERTLAILAAEPSPA